MGAFCTEEDVTAGAEVSEALDQVFEVGEDSHSLCLRGLQLLQSLSFALLGKKMNSTFRGERVLFKKIEGGDLAVQALVVLLDVSSMQTRGNLLWQTGGRAHDWSYPSRLH